MREKKGLNYGLAFAVFFISSLVVVPFSLPCGLQGKKDYKAKKKEVVPQSASFMSPAFILSAGDEVVEKTIKVEGMECEKCSKAVEKEVKKIDGVIEVHADYKAGNCKVKFKKGKVKMEDIYKAIEKAGFKPIKG